MRKIVIYWVLLFAITNPLFAQKVALLIGVGNIPHNKLNTNRDIATMKSLTTHYDRVITVEDSEATYHKLKSTLEKLYSLTSEDTLLFYYTGHGCRAFGSTDEKDRKDEFLMLSGVTYINDTTIRDGIMLDDELNFHFSKIKAKKVILFDCCHSQSMYKSFTGDLGQYAKSMETVFELGFSKNSDHAKAKNSNFIKLSACRDNEQSEDSDAGGIFTLTLQKVLQNQGNMNFSELIKAIQNNLRSVALAHNRAGDYFPNIAQKGLSATALHTKDIFVVPNSTESVVKKDSLESYLNSKKSLKLTIHGGQKRFGLGDTPLLVSKLKKSNNHLYLLEVDNNNYKKLASTTVKACRGKGEVKQCRFEDLVSSTPFGEAKIYLISTPHPIEMEQSSYGKDFRETLLSQLKNISFEVGRVSVYTVGE